MNPSPTAVFLWVAIFAGFLLAGCRNQEAGADSPPAPASQGVEGFYDPQVYESWTYAVTRELPPGTKLGPDDADRAIALPDGSLRLSFEERRVCTGHARPAGFDRDLTTFDIYEDGTLTEREIYDITKEGFIGRGWAPAGVPFAEAVLLTPGLKIAVPAMRGGQSWVVANEDSGRSFDLEVVEVSEVTVPVGTFEAARLRFTATQGEHSTKRTVWFAENVGIVKEEVVHYNADAIRIRERLDLVDWVLPTLDGRPGPGRTVEPATTRAPAPDSPLREEPADDSPEESLDEFIGRMIGDPYHELLPAPLHETSGPPEEDVVDDEGLYE